MTLADLKLPPITFHRAAHYTEGRTEPVRAFVNHRMVGTVAGTTSYFQNPATRPVSTHFGVGKISGKVVIHQYVPLDDTAYGNGNYDPSGRWDDWGYKTTEVNAQTVSIEHQDHWGDDSLKGIVLPEVQEASQKLQALIRWGTIAQWKAAGITIRNWDTNAPILRKEISNIPVDGHHIIMHWDIAGALKPYCWRPWQKDTVGFPRSTYVARIRDTYREALQLVPPPPVVETVTLPKADYDRLLAEKATLLTDKAALVAALEKANGYVAKLLLKLQDIQAVIDRA